MRINNANLLGKVDQIFLRDVLVDSVKVYNLCDGLITNISDFCNGSSVYNTDEGYEVLDRVSEFLQLSVKNLERFYDGRVSDYSDLHRRLRDVFGAYFSLLSYINPVIDECIPLDLSELKIVFSDLKKLVGHLSIFIRKQYELVDYVETKTPEFSLDLYMKDYNLTYSDICDLSKSLLVRSIAYRPRVAVFEDYPSLEDPFYDKVGEEFYDLEFIKVDLVLGIINDEISPEELYLRINGKS